MTVDELKNCLPPRLARWSNEILAASLCYPRVRPFLIAAIMDRESAGGEALIPRGPSGLGDKGYGRGLMQIDSRHHPYFCTSRSDLNGTLWETPCFNVLYGTRILDFNFKATSNEIVAIAGYNCGIHKALAAAMAKPDDVLKVLDSCTTGGNYVSDIYRRMKGFKPTQEEANGECIS